MFALAHKSSVLLSFNFYHFKESYLPCIGKPILLSWSNSDYHTLDIRKEQCRIRLGPFFNHNQDSLWHYQVQLLKPNGVFLELLCFQILHIWLFVELSDCTWVKLACSTQWHLGGMGIDEGICIQWLDLIHLHCDMLTLLQLHGPWIFRHVLVREMTSLVYRLPVIHPEITRWTRTLSSHELRSIDP